MKGGMLAGGWPSRGPRVQIVLGPVPPAFGPDCEPNKKSDGHGAGLLCPQEAVRRHAFLLGLLAKMQDHVPASEGLDEAPLLRVVHSELRVEPALVRGEALVALALFAFPQRT